MDLGLAQKVAVVVGGASGIGLACVKRFLEEGAKVVIWDRAEIDHAKMKELVGSEEDNLHSFVADITEISSVEKALSQTFSRHSKIDHVVHAAAIGSGKFGFPFTNLSPSDWPKVLDVNIMGMVNISHTLAPELIKHSGSTITFIGSVAGQIGSQTDPPYSAAKAANINFAQCIAKDLAKHGVRVNVVNPGMVQTPLNRSVWQAWADQQSPETWLSYEDWAGAKIKSIVPLGTWQTPDDIADMIVFLSSQRARNVTGQCINVDGGFVMHW